MRLSDFFLIISFTIYLISSIGCNGITIKRDPFYPKQGDTIDFTVEIDDVGDMTSSNVWLGGQHHTIISSPKHIPFPTCKYTTNQYFTSIEVKGDVQYFDVSNNDTYGPETLDLTTGWADYENTSRTYSIYVAHEQDDSMEDIFVEAASEFINEFGSFAKDQYQWAHPSHFNNQNAADMLIFLGHGNHHHYQWGKNNADAIDLSTTAFGNFAFCNNYSDVDYLMFFFSCNLLSLDDFDGQHFSYYWLNKSSTRLEKRPFMGLHQLLGFRTLSVITESCFGVCSDNGDDFFYTLAEYFDTGSQIKNSWLWSIGDELDQSDGENRGAVFFNDLYEHDTVFTGEKDDYIYASPNYYGHLWVEYHE